ncbi:MAG: Zn-dependent hydrolase [Neisseriaceae bacterium]|nr:Zn-dependent hydrolase [Neisseriaceae bacterium]
MSLTRISINPTRLNDLLDEFAQIGKTANGGVTRLALSDLDKTARDLFIAKAKAAGFGIKVDAIGNIFVRREGQQPQLSPVLMGSHGDSQPKGGRFDGIYGVLAGLEVLLSLNDQGVTTERPIDLVMWTNEEGARFAPAMMGAAVFTGKMSLEEALARTDRDGLSVGAELARIGYVGTDDFSDHQIHAALEVHIEQGPILENHGNTIGVVTGALGQRWYEVEFTGLASHAGTTPMDMRQDAGLGMAHAMVALNQLGMGEVAAGGRVTVGVTKLGPGSPNVIPASAWFTLEVRHPSADALARIDAEIGTLLPQIAEQHRLGVTIKPILSFTPLAFDPRCIQVVRETTQALGYAHEDMVSGAGHDSCHLSHIAPTAMIFIPCINGLSHNEAEDITPEWSAAGADVLAHSMLRLANEA